MKALNCTLAVLLMATASTAVSAQSTYMFDNPDNREYFGVRVGLNVTSAANGGAMYSNKPGFEAGAVYNMPLWKNLYFEPGLSIFYNAFGTVSYDTYEAPLPLPDGTFTTTERLFQIDGSIRNFGFRIPLTVGYHFDFSEDLKVHVFTGPQLNLSLVARYHQDGMITPDDEQIVGGSKSIFGTGGFKHVDLQWTFGVGVTYQRYYMSVGGAVGCTKMKSASSAIISDYALTLGRDVRRNIFTLTLGYNF